MGALSGLKPERVFAYFEKLCSVPHGSGNTKSISDLCVSFARELGLPYRQEPCGNVVIRKAASPGCENAAPVILQGHMDMVCAAEDGCTRDMSREGLDLRTDGQWIWADKTSLGGDDCIALAMILAVLEDDTLTHPPLEAVFTVDEETGMDGALALDCSDLWGRRLLNLDSESEGVFTVSCAGGMRSDCLLPAPSAPLTDMPVFTLTVSGLQGGHSGADIHLERGSAIRLMARVLCTAAERFPGIRLASVSGGRFDNVICSRCESAVAVPAACEKEFAAFVSSFAAVLQSEYAVTDPGVSLTCVPACGGGRAVTPEGTATLLRTLAALPQGVEAMDTDFPGLVQTSLNMGVIRLAEDGLHVSYSIRSSLESRKQMLAQRVRAVVQLAGGTVRESGAYPSWQYNRDSALRETVLDAYRAVTGREGRAEGMHGGLECGLFMEKLPGLDAVSFGPDILDIHSPRERLSVPSTRRVYALLCEALRRCC